MNHKHLTAPFAVKSNDPIKGLITGMASVYGVTDAYGDVVMPGAFDRTLDELDGKIVVLNQHNPNDPIGMATLTDSALSLNAVIQLELELQSARDMLVRVKAGLIDGISIGYEVIKEAYVGNVRQLSEIRLWEISLCTFPANQFARVTDVKGNKGDVRQLLTSMHDLNDTARRYVDVYRKANANVATLTAPLDRLLHIIGRER